MILQYPEPCAGDVVVPDGRKLTWNPVAALLSALARLEMQKTTWAEFVVLVAFARSKRLVPSLTAVPDHVVLAYTMRLSQKILPLVAPVWVPYQELLVTE